MMTSTRIVTDDSDDDYSIEYYDYEMVDEKKDDDDEYTYEEELLEVVMEDNINNDEEVDSTVAPILPNRTTVAPRPPPTIQQNTVLPPSKQRAQAAGSAGLSELSKQLRILQAKCEAQTVENHRLERQIKILADLQGISVKDLRQSLNDACANEAFAELQSRVSKLKFELEAATLAKRAELMKDAAAPHIANLELRIGELEEVEEAGIKKIENLYKELRQGKSKTTRLESENQQLKKALQNMINRLKNETTRATQLETSFQTQIENLQQEQAKRIRDSSARTGTSTESSSGGARANCSAVSPEMAKEYDKMVNLLKEKDAQLRGAQARLYADEIRRAKKLKEMEERAEKVQMDMKVEMDKLSLTVKELENADGQSGLRLAQFKARFAVQDERIIDMGQQLDSLYTAFTLLKEEFDSENDRHAMMQRNLDDADAEIAIKIEKEENDRRLHPNSEADEGRENVGNVSDSAPFGGSSSSDQSVPRFINTSPSVVDNTMLNTIQLAPVSPCTPTISREYLNNENNLVNNNRSSIDHDYVTPTTIESNRSLRPSPQRTPTTWQLLFPDQSSSMQDVEGEYQLISGPLIVESKSMLRKWKTKQSKIYLRGEGYQWKIGDKKSFPIRFGISKVEYNTNYPLSFVVHLDPNLSTAPVIRVACTDEHDYHRWMAALNKATVGVEYEGGSAFETFSPTDSSSLQWSSPRSEARRVSNCSEISNGISVRFDSNQSTSMSSAPNVEEQEAVALERILEISRYET